MNTEKQLECAKLHGCDKLRCLGFVVPKVCEQPWDVTQPSRGLGDTIAKFTHATGIAKLVKGTVGSDCGCNQRQQAANQLFPY